MIAFIFCHCSVLSVVFIEFSRTLGIVEKTSKPALTGEEKLLVSVGFKS